MDLISKYLSNEQFRIQSKKRATPAMAAERDAVALLLQWEMLKAITPAMNWIKATELRSPFSGAAEKQYSDLIAEAGALACNFMDYIEDMDEEDQSEVPRGT